jgi:15-cis-phytoene synthase
MTGDHGDPERALVLSYAPRVGRGALAALLALDDALAQLLRTTREPALGQMRLAWWREALARLDQERAPAEPVLQALEREALLNGLRGTSLVPIVHGWEVLIEEETLGSDALSRFAEGRGHLFAAAGAAMAAALQDPLVEAGQGWALADLSRNLEHPEEAEMAKRLAIPLLNYAASRRWSRRGRALGALVHLARLNLRTPRDARAPVGAPHRVGRLLWHRLTGK